MPKNLKASDASTEIRKEYSELKKHKAIIVEKSAYAWVEKNVVLITERMERKTIKRLIDSILKFDEKFSTVKDKIPSVGKILDNAETSLNLVLSGKTSDSRAEDVLKHLSIIYTLLSDFFASDLPVLVRAPMFKFAKENPKLRLDSISVPGHNPKMLASAFEMALRPSKDEIKLLSKVYRGVALPSLNATAASNELLALTFEELLELSQIGRVPMVATEPSIPSKPEESLPLTETINEATFLENIILSEQEGVDKLQTLIQNIDQVKKMIDSDPNLKAKLSGAYEKMRSAAISASNNNEFTQFFRGLKRPGDLTKSPQGKTIAQAEMAVNTFKSLGTLAPTVQKMVDKDEITDEDVKLVRGALQKALKGGMLQRALDVFKTQPFPGLDGDSIINAMVAELENEVAKSSEQSPAAPATPATPAAPAAGNQNLNESKENFINMFKNIAAASGALVTGKDIATAKPTQGSTGALGSNVTTPASSTVGGLQTSGTSTASAGGAPAGGKTEGGLMEVPDDASDAQLKAITAKVGVEPDRLRKLATTRGVRLLVNPQFFQIK
jgi:hypothetical protein